MGAGRSLEGTILGMVGFAALALLGSRLLPRVLAGMRREQDLFLAVSVATGLAIAGAGALLTGIPLALAAFIAGLAITEGPVAKEARRRLLPFRDLFAIFFFVAIGTLIDPTALGRGLGWLAVCIALVAVAKSLVIFGLARVARVPASHAQLAVGLGQVGEFGFVLATVAFARGVLPSEVYAALLASVALSIAVSTIAVRVIRRPVRRGPGVVPIS